VFAGYDGRRYRLLVRQPSELAMAVDGERDEHRREQRGASSKEHPGLPFRHASLSAQRSDMNPGEVADTDPTRIDQSGQHHEQDDGTEEPGHHRYSCPVCVMKASGAAR
jgi:hypothetical protein